MKIVFVVSSLNAGGAERVATTLCNAWSARGDAVTLIQTYSGGGKPFYRLSPGVEVISLADLVRGEKRSSVGYVRRLLTLRNLISQREPDVIISFLPNVSVATILATRLMKIPVIVCERNDPSVRSRLDPWEIASNITFRFADMLTVQTEAVAGKVGAIYPNLKKIRVVHNPLPANPMACAERRANGAKTLISVGRLAKQKRMDLLIKAFSDLAPHFPEWSLHIYGDGPEKNALGLLIAENGMHHRIFLKGITTEPLKVMAESDVFAMTSEHEGFPNALLEAMSLGLPCIVTDCPSGPREITRNGEDAMLVPLNNQAALTDALYKMMTEEKTRNEFSNRARQSVLHRFNLNAVINRWDELFSEILPVDNRDLGGPVKMKITN